MTTIKDVAAALEAAWPLAWQEPYDNAGLTVGSPEREVTGVLVAVDVTEEVMDEAAAARCNLIVTHHPLIFHGLKSLTGATRIERLAARAVREEIALYAAHTNLDSAPDGLSHALARELGLTDRRTLAPIDEQHGLGAIGLTGAADFMAVLAEKFPRLRYSTPPANIRKVALCTGSGASLIDAARRQGADLYVTADLKYHEFMDAAPMGVADIGHFESEYAAIALIHEKISENFTTFAVRKSAKSLNPVKYR